MAGFASSRSWDILAAGRLWVSFPALFAGKDTHKRGDPHGGGKFVFWDDSSPFSAYGPGLWHVNGALILDQMRGMPGFAWQSL
jgi:hypothetical protein